MISSFKGEYRFLSNFYPCIMIDSQFPKIVYPTSEHYYQASKSDDPKIRLGIANIGSPAMAKRMGATILPSNWNTKKLEVMLRILRKKFEMGELETKLLRTFPRVLCEENFWHDNFWGICNCSSCATTVGKNTLGEFLMEVRHERMCQAKIRRRAWLRSA